MDKRAIWKWMLLAVLVGVSSVLFMPEKSAVGRMVGTFGVRTGIRPGLDIAGGISLAVEVDEDQVRDAVRADARAGKEAKTDEQIEAQVKEILKDAQDRALVVIRNRIDRLGIAEPAIFLKGNRIIVELPGVDKETRKEAEDSVRSAAFLSFRLVHEDNARLASELFEKGWIPRGYEVASVGDERFLRRTADYATLEKSAEYLKEIADFHVPDVGFEFMLEREERMNEVLYRPCFVKRRRDRRELTGDYLRKASVDYQTFGQPIVLLDFNSEGAKRFAKITTDNVNRQLAIILDGTLYSAPVIRGPITGGRAQIEGNFTNRDAVFLRNILNAGSLRAPMKIVETREVDPTLGRDAVQSGIWAGVYGCGAIVLLMGGYYLVSGLLANLALILNVVLLPLSMILTAGFLGLFAREGGGGAGAVQLPVLTLPGIAGIALTVGMAVDANVLIFERIREESRAGKGLLLAIQAGYERAFTAILDSNLTTIITAVILFVMGTGPIRGYAVTLTAGLIASLYTAVVVTRMCYNGIAARTSSPGVVRMFSLFRTSNLDFMGKWKIAVSASVVIILASWVLMTIHGIQNPRSVFGVDFTGGASLTMGFTKQPDVEKIRTALSEARIGDATIQYQVEREAGGKREYLQIKVSSMEEGKIAEKVLTEKFPEAGFSVKQREDVGPQVGREIKGKAVWAMVVSLLAMIVYISWRFEFGFALGAVVALFHDVLITAGLCHVLGFQINMTIVAALMTIVGYSVNDTIVIFDRIREDLRLIRNKSFLEICNLSMNQTLSRTLLTNFLTMVSVLSLLVFGGGAIKDFSVTMFIGMIAGTYSTVYIATPVVLLWYRFKTPDLGTKAIP